MTAAEYLILRGWALDECHDPDCDHATEHGNDPPRYSDPHGELTYDEPEALTLQGARDAVEERAAWVAFAAAAMQTEQALYNNDTAADRADRRANALPPDGGEGNGYSTPFDTGAAGEQADAMLAEYRKRFAVEVEG